MTAGAGRWRRTGARLRVGRGSRRVIGCLLGAGVLFGVLGAGTLAATAATVGPRCVRPHSTPIASGRAPEGRRWTVTGAISNQERCHHWLLRVSFAPLGVRPGTWRDGWQIPVNDSLPRNFSVAAFDQEISAAHRAVSGITGADVRTVVFTLSGGGRLIVKPRAPREGLRQTNPWLRRLRYFNVYYPAGEAIRVAVLRGPGGTVLAKVHQQEGEIDGPI